MEFWERKRRSSMPKADTRNPWMGLNGLACSNPAYWCRMHEVWLSEEDVAKKRCYARLTADMFGYRRCNCLERREKNPFLEK